MWTSRLSCASGAGNAHKRDQEQRQILIDRFQDTPSPVVFKVDFCQGRKPVGLPLHPR